MRPKLLRIAALAALTAGPALCQFSAGELWAKALEAKGWRAPAPSGQERLIRGDLWFRKVPFYRTLYVLPDGLWRYYDESDSVLGRA